MIRPSVGLPIAPLCVVSIRGTNNPRSTDRSSSIADACGVIVVSLIPTPWPEACLAPVNSIRSIIACKSPAFAEFPNFPFCTRENKGRREIDF
ncbi:MAG: hypothetical protein P1P82_10840 [Bacteroidales bacterium]|nr:hypothetical protein [Bacteroidales bacterium]